jgi:hypothetical protein
MWTVTAEAPADKVYEDLKQEFDEKQVPKETKKWVVNHPRRGMQEHSKPVHAELSGKARAEQDDKALKFRRGLKMVQQQIVAMPPSKKVKATISGDTKTFSVKLEEA